MTRFAINPWQRRNAGYTPIPGAPPAFGGAYAGGGFRSSAGSATPTESAAPPLDCAGMFATFSAANRADFATRADALRAFGVASPECLPWVTSQLAAAPAPATMSDTQCANAWDAFLVAKKTAGGMAYPDQASALAAFASASPQCQAWASAQIAAATGRQATQAIVTIVQADAQRTLTALGLTCAQWTTLAPETQLSSVTPYVGVGDTPQALMGRIDALCNASSAPPASSSSSSSPMLLLGAAALALLAFGKGKL